MYSITQACRQRKNYILGKETIILIYHEHLQFIQTQGKLQIDRHHKWSTYLQQFHLNIKYKKGSNNRVVDFLSRPSVVVLTIVLNSCGHKTFEWLKLYKNDTDFSTTCHMLLDGNKVPYFHLQYALLFDLVHLRVPSSECAMLIWEAHYSQVAGHFVVEKNVAIL